MAAPITIQAIHHGAVPVANVARSMPFYTQLFGAKLRGVVNGTVTALQRGYPEVALFQLAGMDGFGLALQYDTIPAPKGLLEGTVWSLETSSAEVERLSAELNRRGRPNDTPSPLPDGCPMENKLAFQDPDGNGWTLCVPRKEAAGTAPAIRYVSLEATDLRQAEAFYSGQLGLECEARQPDLLAFSVGASGQWLFVRKVAEMSPRTALVQGPHVALAVSREVFDSAYASLPNREQYWERETSRVPWEEPWERVGYFADPFYNRLALVMP